MQGVIQQFGMVRGSQSERAKSQKALFKNIIFGSHLAVSTEQSKQDRVNQGRIQNLTPPVFCIFNHYFQSYLYSSRISRRVKH